MNALHVIELFAGHDPSGKPFVEQLQVAIGDDDSATLARSPAFIKGIARGDKIKLNRETGQFEVLQRSGNLCIRIFSKGDIRPIEEAITSEITKLGGDIDLETPRMLIYSIHVSCGFAAIEAIMNRYANSPETQWIYGNVYDPEDGQTPLNWWLDILKPE